MDEISTGWGFVLVPGTSSTYKKLKRIWFVALNKRRGQIL